MRAATAGRLAVASGPVAGQRQQQRGEAERPERGHVDDQPGEEPGDGSGDRPAEQRDRNEGDEQHVRTGAADRDRRERRHLHDRDEEHDQRDLRRRPRAHGLLVLADEHEDRVDAVEVGERLDLHLLPQVGVGLPHARHPPDRDPAGIERGELARAPAGGDDGVADRDLELLRDAVEDQRRGGCATVLDDAGGARLDVERRDRELLVGEQRHPRRARVDARHAAEEPVLGDDRSVERDAVVRADGDDDVLGEPAGRAGDDRRGEAGVVAREARPVAEREQCLELVVLVRGELVLDRLLPQRGVLLPELLGVRAGRQERVTPRVDVAKRLRDALAGDRERPQHGGSRALRGCDRTVVRLAEREGDQHEREHDEAPDDEPPPEGGVRSRGWLAGDGTPDVDAQHRRACGAMTGHSGRLYRPLPADGPADARLHAPAMHARD